MKMRARGKFIIYMRGVADKLEFARESHPSFLTTWLEDFLGFKIDPYSWQEIFTNLPKSCTQKNPVL